MITVYNRVERCCRDLARRQQVEFPNDIKSVAEMNNLGESARHVHYVKIRDRSVGRFKVSRIHRDPNFSPLPEIRDAMEQIKSMASRITNLETAISFAEIMAEATFLTF